MFSPSWRWRPFRWSCTNTTLCLTGEGIRSATLTTRHCGRVKWGGRNDRQTLWVGEADADEWEPNLLLPLHVLRLTVKRGVANKSVQNGLHISEDRLRWSCAVSLETDASTHQAERWPTVQLVRDPVARQKQSIVDEINTEETCSSTAEVLSDHFLPVALQLLVHEPLKTLTSC
ncbi:unnamed protein product [Pleuronectes platessa]|uniref:Uncharacterized protein n=1 Tax=Pleuronectes platessa TaxID=8262 RepID=A0A9N7YJR3_PLEPL|nr:unnamed protein product [Pleuronectes platessa]